MSKVRNVAIAWLSPGEVSTDFHNSVVNVLTGRPGVLTGKIDVRCGGGITRGRNIAVAKFLSMGDEWMLFVDSDMSWTPEDFDKVIATADVKKRPVVGGLCFGQDGQIGPFAGIFPTVFHLQPEGGYMPMWDYPDDDVVEVDATGAAFLLVHRSVLLDIRDRHADDGDFAWFHEYVDPGKKMWVSEDVAFCERVREAGHKIHVATGAKIAHHKGVNYSLTEGMYRVFRGAHVDA
jgi:GT2 family glycosyltransferase